MRVLLVDDHALFRAGLASLLTAWGLDVVGHARDGHDAVEQARALRPDLVLMDLNMGAAGGLAATRAIKAELPDAKVVMVTVADDDESLFAALASGADGYLLKDMTDGELRETLRGIGSGDPVLSRGLAARLVAQISGRVRNVKDDLTQREREVLRLLAAGATNREIAGALGVSENTVGFHVKNVLAKLHVRNRAQAAVYATRFGLAEVPQEPAAAPSYPDR